MWHFVHVLFISIPYKFGSRVIYFSLSSVFLVRSLSLGLVTGFLVWVRLGQHIRLVSFFVSFRFVVSCTLHVRSLLVILCSFPRLLFCCFQLPCSLRVSMVETSKKRVQLQWQRVLFDLDHFSSARPSTEHAAIKITLKESAELALHSSESQQPTLQSPDFSHTSLAASQSDLVEQLLTIPVLPSASAHVLIHESMPSSHVFRRSSLCSASFVSEQSSSDPVHSQHLRP